MSNENLDQGSSADSDSRYFPRWEVDEIVLCQLDGDREARQGKTKDISCAGARIIGDWQIAPHQKVKLTIQLSPKKRITVNAHILWVRLENNQQEMGVTFYDTSDQVQETILEHAFNVDKDKVINQWYKGWDNS